MKALGSALVAGLLVAGCGDEAADPAAQAEAGLAAVLAERLDDDADVVVSCPEELEIEVDAAFTCSVTIDDAAEVELDLVVADDGTVELQRAVVPTQAAEDYLADELAGAAEGPVEPDCGDEPLLVADVGDELFCQVVRTSDGAVRDVVLTVVTLDGTVRYRVEAPATVPGSTTTTSPP